MISQKNVLYFNALRAELVIHMESLFVHQELRQQIANLLNGLEKYFDQSYDSVTAVVIVPCQDHQLENEL